MLFFFFYQVNIPSMFTRITESGGRRYLQVVESYRNESGKPRQRVIANLGRIDGMKDGHLDALIRGLSRAAGREEPAKPTITHQPALSFGDVFVLHELWKDLGFHRALGRALRSGKRKLDVEALVRAMVFNRLCDPTSKLGCLRWLETVIVAHDPLRAAEQSDRRRARIREIEIMAEKMVGRLDAQDDGKTARGRRASDRGAYSRFTRAVAEAELTRFLKADYTADRFSWSVDDGAIAQAELFDGKLALLSNAADITPTEAVTRYKALADIERGFRVLKSDIEIAPVHHRLPDRIRAHALICFLALVLYRVMRMRLKAKGHSASPRTALDLLARIQRHRAKIAEHLVDGISTTTSEQLELFNTLNLPKPT